MNKEQLAFWNKWLMSDNNTRQEMIISTFTSSVDGLSKDIADMINKYLEQFKNYYDTVYSHKE